MIYGVKYQLRFGVEKSLVVHNHFIPLATFDQSNLQSTSLSASHKQKTLICVICVVSLPHHQM